MSSAASTPINPDDPGRGPTLMGILWTFTVLAAVAVALRFHVRKKLAGSWGVDDWLMLIAVICQIAGASLFTVSHHFGLGKHDSSLQIPDQMVDIMKWGWIAMGPGQVTSVAARVSIAISLVSLFGVHAWFKWFLIVLTSVATSLGIIMIVLSYTQARPVEAIWNVFMTGPGVYRLDTRVFLYFGYITQSVYTFSDVTFVLLPVLIIWKLKMPLHRRVGLIILMCFSLFTALMSILKTYTLHWQASASTTDPVYQNSLQVIYANLEQTCVVIMGCVPTLRAIVTVHPGLSQIGSSLTNLIGRTTHQRSSAAKSQQPSSASSGKNSFQKGNMSSSVDPYYHLGVDEYNMDHVPVQAVAFVEGGASVKGSSEHLVERDLVRRTDQFMVTYSKPDQRA